MDREGNVCQGARVTLRRGAGSQTIVSDEQGRYVFGDLPAGPWQVTVSADGFTSQTLTGTLAAGESREIAPVVLLVTSSSQVQVSADLHEIAQAQLDQQEQQRVLGIVPNFYVSYAHDAVALTSRQKFQLAWRNEIDPMTFIATAATASLEQASNSPASWGQGTAGYAKRYAAAYGDDLIGTMLGSAVFPSLFHQDPRYFYKGTGTRMGRILYAMRSSLICRGDNGHLQLNYSSILGDFAAAGLSNAYYPASARDGFTLTAQHVLIGKATGAVQNIVQEFIVRRLTPKAPKDSSPQP